MTPSESQLERFEARRSSPRRSRVTLKRLRAGAVTIHGFRSAFRDWASEQTSVANDVVEQALAHTIQNKVEAAYRRNDLFAKRRDLMVEWDNFIKSRR